MATAFIVFRNTFNFWSAFAGIRQKRLKRFFAISGVANVGFLLLALASGSFQGINSMIFYVLAYILTSFYFLAFPCA